MYLYKPKWWPILGGGNSNIFYFHPYLGKIPILTNIFQLGWNHQLELFWLEFRPCFGGLALTKIEVSWGHKQSVQIYEGNPLLIFTISTLPVFRQGPTDTILFWWYDIWYMYVCMWYTFLSVHTVHMQRSKSIYRFFAWNIRTKSYRLRTKWSRKGIPSNQNGLNSTWLYHSPEK